MTNPDLAGPTASPVSRRLVLGSLVGAAAVAAPIAAAPRAEAATYLSARGQHNVCYTARYQYARRVPYVYGGMHPSRGFDCSGMTKWLYYRQGVYLPRSANDQYRYMRKISRSAARPGDLVFFLNSSGRAYHTGIFLGGNTMVDAGNPRTDISVRAIFSSAARFGTRRY